MRQGTETECDVRETTKRRQPGRRCASLTSKGRPCKAVLPNPQIPFCHSHVPYGAVEFVVGGPLDGLSFFHRWGSPHPSEIMGITRSQKGGVVMCQLGGLQDPRQYSIGVYRFRYRSLIPEWQWEGAVSDGRQE